MDKILDYEKDWEDFWKAICTDENGTLNIVQVKKELSDYKYIMDKNAMLNLYLSGGDLSQADYPLDVLTAFHDLHFVDKKIARDDILAIIEDDENIGTVIDDIKKYFEEYR